MPKYTKRRSQSRQLVQQRWAKERRPTKESEESSSESESVLDADNDDDIDRTHFTGHSYIK